MGFVQFQPSEIAKVFLIIFVATYLYKKRETLNTFKTIAGVTLFAAMVFGLIFLEPDLSTTIVIFITFLCYNVLIGNSL